MGGMVSSDSVTGICNPKDFCFRLLIGIAHMQSFPKTTNEHTMVHCLPVDTAARALLELAESNAHGIALDIVSGAPLLTMERLRELLLKFGTPYNKLPVQSFKNWIECAEKDAALSLWPVMSWAKNKTCFPIFNQRYRNLDDSLLNLLTDETVVLLKEGVDECCLHRSLEFLYHGSD